jgi:hypothetical protein
MVRCTGNAPDRVSVARASAGRHGLAQFLWRAFGLLPGFSREGDGALDAARWMPSDRVMEPVEISGVISGDGVFGLLAGLPGDRPDQLSLDGREMCEEDQKSVRWTVLPTQAHRVVVAVPAPAHPDQDATDVRQVFAKRDHGLDHATFSPKHQSWSGPDGHEVICQS